ncbi:MAG: DUF3261 domain-containing protein, partial [Pseudomonadota bacterium]
ALTLAVAAGACAHKSAGGGAPPQRPPGSAGFQPPAAADLPLPDSIPGVFTVRQKLVAKSPHGGGSFEAVLAKKPGRLTLVGLLPYGARAFLLEQQGSDVQFTNYLPRDVPFPPSWVLLDVYRVFGTWLGPPLADGEREGVAKGERVRERWRAGKLIERRFLRAAKEAPPANAPIMITYQEQEATPGVAERVQLRNDRFGYELSIQTLPTPPASPASPALPAP